MANIVIYGAEISGICAAIKAKGNLLGSNESHNIKIIVTNPSGKLGGLATVGGLNCWDIFNSPLMKYDEADKGNKCCQNGTFGVLLKNHWQNYKVDLGTNTYTVPEWEVDEDGNKKLTFYHDDSMETALEKYLMVHIGNNVSIESIRAMDIVDVDYITDTLGNKTINKLYLRSVYRSEDGYIRWGRKTRAVEGDYFIDASDDGKLTSALTEVTVGRYDWPESTLDECEKTGIPVARQQVATLYFQVKNLTTNKFIPDGGDTEVNAANNLVYEYNIDKMNTPFAIKKYNLAKNSHTRDGDIYCANTFLIFDVDGRAHYRDFTTKYYPKYMLSESMHRDEAWVAARDEINTDNFQDKLRGFVGFENCEIVKIRDNNISKPIIAEQLYIRESVHLPLDPDAINNNTEESNYAVKRSQTLMELPENRNTDTLPDEANRAKRIGLGSYNADIHPYIKSDVIQLSEQYPSEYEFLNMAPSANKMRTDLASEQFIKEYDFAKNEYVPFETTRKDKYKNVIKDANDKAIIDYGISSTVLPPTYLPYDALLPYDVTNLLVAGTASGICSFSWAELRVLPNLCVLGDAAGVAVAYAIRKGCTLKDINEVTHLTENGTLEYTHLKNIQSILALDRVRTNSQEDLTLKVDDKYWWTNDAIVDKEMMQIENLNKGNYNPDSTSFEYTIS